MNEQLIVTLVQTLAWPLVALIAYFGLKKDAVRLASGASDLKKMIDDPGKLIDTLDRIAKTVDDLKKETKVTRESVDDLVIKEESRAIPEGPVIAVDLTPDQMFDQIKEQWDSIVAEIRRRAEGVGVKTRLVGYVGVNTTVDELVEKGAITGAAGALTKQVSNRWQPMMRNQPRKSEWLTPQVYGSFMALAEEARAKLTAQG